MFYIISSRIPVIASDNTNRKYFKLFVTGAVVYILLHYYLNRKIQSGITERVRKYIYYMMVIDFSIACVLLKYIRTNVPEQEDEPDEDIPKLKDTINPPKLSRDLEEHQKQILHERMLLQKAFEQKEQANDSKKNKEKVSDSKSDKSDKSDKSNKSNKSTTSTKSDKSTKPTKSAKSTKPTKSTKSKSTKSDKSIKSDKSDSKSTKSEPTVDKREKINKKAEQKAEQIEITETEIPIYNR